MKNKIIVSLIIAIVCFFVCTSVFAKEEILSFHTNILVEQNSDLSITEKITAQAYGQKIKRGIYRDLPLSFQGIKTNIDVNHVLRDGQKIPFSTELKNGMLRVYMGDMNKTIQSGVYKYEISYRYQNIIRKSKDFKEDILYLNLTGNEWDFPILKATANISFPPEMKLLYEPEVYTGKTDSTQLKASIKKYTGALQIQSMEPLRKREGMTLKAHFKSGFLTFLKKEGNILKTENKAPSSQQSFLQTFTFTPKQHFIAVLAFCCYIGIVILYAYFTWNKHGKDGIQKIAYPRFDIPNFKSTGALFYLWQKRYILVDKSLLILSHLSSLRQKGLINIEFPDTNRTIIEKVKEAQPEAPEDEFFMNTAQPIYVLSSSKYDASFTGYIDCYEDFLQNISKPLLKSNALYSSIFLVMMIFFLTIFSFIYHKNLFPFPELFISFWVYFITLFSFLKIKAKNYKCIRSFLIKFVLVAIILYFSNRSNFYDIFSDVTLMDVFIPFLAGIATAIYKIAIIRIYDKGLIYLEHLEGIKMFLEGVDDLSQKNFKQAELEKLLPYAIVFGLQNKWSEKMEKYFNFTPPDNDPFTNKREFSRFSSVLKRVSTPPSKSGRGGGGRSGGGGGGGGGGGF